MTLLIVETAISSFLASLGFGVLFNIKGKNLILAGLTGTVGAVLYKCGLYFGMGQIYSNFLGSVGLALCGEILARKCKTPVTTFVVCALIPLVPGGGMYRTMLEVIKGNINDALSVGLETLSIAAVLALGILVVSTFTALYLKLRKNIDPYMDNNFYNL